MKAVHIRMCVLMLIALFPAACSIHIPYGWYGDDFRNYRVVILADPDDADVLLDGRLIGAAYEFSRPNAPLRLNSLNHELVIKKAGFREEAIRLTDYSTEEITVRLKLLRDEHYYPSKTSRGERDKPHPPSEPKTVPPPATVPEITQPQPPAAPPASETPAGQKPEAPKAVTVKLDITPGESAIYLDGKFWGISPVSGPIDNLRLEQGSYKLQVVKPGYLEYKTTLDVKKQDISLAIRLQSIK